MSYSSPTCFSLISIIAFSSYYWIARPDAIKQYGTVGSDGKSSVAYGILFDKTANTRQYSVQSVVKVVTCTHQWCLNLVEALNGTLRAAKRQKKVLDVLPFSILN